MYLHALAHTPSGSVLFDVATRLLSDDAQAEVGIATRSVPRCGLERRQSKRRGRDGLQQQSEVRVRGLEGIALGMRSDFKRDILKWLKLQKGLQIVSVQSCTPFEI
jgi:hypothetical protein